MMRAVGEFVGKSPVKQKNFAVGYASELVQAHKQLENNTGHQTLSKACEDLKDNFEAAFLDVCASEAGFDEALYGAIKELHSVGCYKASEIIDLFAKGLSQSRYQEPSLEELAKDQHPLLFLGKQRWVAAFVFFGEIYPVPTDERQIRADAGTSLVAFVEQALSSSPRKGELICGFLVSGNTLFYSIKAHSTGPGTVYDELYRRLVDHKDAVYRTIVPGDFFSERLNRILSSDPLSETEATYYGHVADFILKALSKNNALGVFFWRRRGWNPTSLSTGYLARLSGQYFPFDLPVYRLEKENAKKDPFLQAVLDNNIEFVKDQLDTVGEETLKKALFLAVESVDGLKKTNTLDILLSSSRVDPNNLVDSSGNTLLMHAVLLPKRSVMLRLVDELSVNLGHANRSGHTLSDIVDIRLRGDWRTELMAKLDRVRVAVPESSRAATVTSTQVVCGVLPMSFFSGGPCSTASCRTSSVGVGASSRKGPSASN